MTYEGTTPTGPAAAMVTSRRSIAIALLPLMAVVFVAYLVTGVAMPVLPVHVHERLGFGTFMVGLVAGTQFAATLISRLWAGRYADVRGSKRAVLAGLCFAGAAGAVYLASTFFAARPVASVAILIAGRALLGVMESFVITGVLSWGLALGGPHHTGKVMSWVGTALYTAFAVGAPLGTALYTMFGFAAVALATMVLPLATVSVVAPLRPIAPGSHARSEFGDVVRAVWMPGVALALSGVGFAAVTTFVPLLFVSEGWGHAWLALTSFSVAFMVVRVTLGHLPDRVGGMKVAFSCMAIEALGLLLIWHSSGPVVALVGVTITGIGYSLVYPGLGVEAIRLAPAESRGAAMGTFTAFLDLALGLASPLLGLMADVSGLSAVFAVSAVIVAVTALVGASRFGSQVLLRAWPSKARA